MNSGKVLLGIVAAAAAGAALGILFAPDNGLNTRKKISKKGEDYLDNIKNKFDDFILNATIELENVQSKAGKLFDNGKERATEVKSKMENGMS